MKTKILCLFLSILFLLTLTACGDTPEATTSNYYRIPGETKEEQGFTITSKKYTYKKRDYLLLDMENQTDKNYTVTVTVRYYNAEGKELRNQKQVFTGWAAGWQNYFLFQSNITFDSYTYTVELKDYAGECYMQDYIALSSIKVKKTRATPLLAQKDYTKYPVISAEIETEVKGSQPLTISGRYVIFDKNGEIYLIDTAGSHFRNPGKDYTSITLYYDIEAEELVLPEELDGEINAIFVVSSIKPQ